ncbi:hypothetical protein [Bacillus sp. TL12]|uniref:hypothetical protein n=1 Tax=Bacillus sp. TL12 TaxID=2894756 RepID=UPI001F5297D3|nr:hypothetical protein [Bacillus sp. TL12]MCI0768094.1 hypothetical protein [Bacillus sp. TL12]
MSKEIDDYKNLLERLTPIQQEKLEELRQEALTEPLGFFEYINKKEKTTKN